MEKNKTKKKEDRITKGILIKISRALVYCLLFAMLFIEVSNICMHKQIDGRWNMTAKVKGFYNEEKLSYDTIILGSSHAYCSLDPLDYARLTGKQTYTFATPAQPLWISYYYMREAIREQRPSQVLLEIHMMAYSKEDYTDEATNHTAIDPIPFSKNKIDMIKASVPAGQRRYYIFHLMKYHDRWQNLSKADFVRAYEHETDPDKGFVRLEERDDSLEYKDVTTIKSIRPSSQKNIDYLNKIIKLAAEEGIELILFKAPSNSTIEEKGYYNGVREIAGRHQVAYIDFNNQTAYQEMGLEINEDFYDRGHLNEAGSGKFLHYFIREFNIQGK